MSNGGVVTDFGEIFYRIERLRVDSVPNGGLVDVQLCLGETDVPCESEQNL